MAILFSAKFILFIIEIFSILEIISTSSWWGKTFGFGGNNNQNNNGVSNEDEDLIIQKQQFKEKMDAIRKASESAKNSMPMGSRTYYQPGPQVSESGYKASQFPLVNKQPSFFQPSSLLKKPQLFDDPQNNIPSYTHHNPTSLSNSRNYPSLSSSSSFGSSNPSPSSSNPYFDSRTSNPLSSSSSYGSSNPSTSSSNPYFNSRPSYPLSSSSSYGSSNPSTSSSNPYFDSRTSYPLSSSPLYGSSNPTALTRNQYFDVANEDIVNVEDMRNYLNKEGDNEWKDCWKDQSVIGMALSEHTRLRARHGSPPLAIDFELSKTAQAYAIKLAYAVKRDGSKAFKHSTQKRYGENLFMASGMNSTCHESVKYAINHWYNEIQYYDYATCASTDKSKTIGHFTQLVWDSSKKFGLGVAKIFDTVVVITRTFPKGNIITFYSKNVKPLIARDENPLPKLNRPSKNANKSDSLIRIPSTGYSNPRYKITLTDANGNPVQHEMTQGEIDEIMKNAVRNPDGTMSAQFSIIPKDNGTEDVVNVEDMKNYLRKEGDNEWRNCWQDRNVVGMALSEHNRLRARHGTPPLIMDEELSKTAQAYAVKLAYTVRKNGKQAFAHSTQQRYGENLYLGLGINSTCYESVKYAINAWYNEIQYYDYATCSTKDKSKMVGHFTQLVWESSKKLGLGAARIFGVNIIVTRNLPKGNVISFFSQNVKPLIARNVNPLPPLRTY